MPARLVIFLFLLLTGTAKLYMWLGVTDPLKAVGTGLILHELHERNKEQERAERDYDGNWDNPDDDSQYDDWE